MMTSATPEPATEAQSAPPAADLEAENAALRAEIAALRAGEDDTPVPEGAVGTPEQWLYALNRMTGDERQQWMHSMAASSETAYKCVGRFNASHAGQIADLRIELDRALRRTHELSGRPTQHAYEAACEALEKRRVALADAIGLPDEGFYEAVKTVTELRERADRAIPADAKVQLWSYLSGWLPSYLDQPGESFNKVAQACAASLVDDVISGWPARPIPASAGRS